jgi:HlyD family secretion protein
MRDSRFALLALTLLAALSLLGGCAAEAADAYGNFEADEVVVSAETSGRLTRFDVEQGDVLSAGAVVAEIETEGLDRQREELLAQQSVVRGRVAEAEAQILVLQAQLATAMEELARTRRLFAAQAATARQLEQAEGEARVFEARIQAARAGVASVTREVEAVEARTRQVDERIERSQVTNPVAGTVLATYARAGELAQPGAPLYRIADLSALTLRAYVSGAQLSSIRLGQDVLVRIDVGDDEREALPGRVTRIASEAEFTPTQIQTRDERTGQVYAVEVRVPNPDGRIKVGMPGELELGGA